MEPIVLAIPKGRIAEELTPLFQKAGIEPEAEFYNLDTRLLRFKTNRPNLDIIKVRSFDVATFVAFGGAHIGVAGRDVLLEFDTPELYAPIDLGIGHCRLSVAEEQGLAQGDDPTRWSHVTVATKYPNLTRKYFAERGVQAEIIKLNGAMELAPTLGMCKRIVDLVSSGKTLRENGLVEVEKIMDVSSYLIINRTAYKTRAQEMYPLVEMFEKAVHGSSSQQ